MRRRLLYKINGGLFLFNEALNLNDGLDFVTVKGKFISKTKSGRFKLDNSTIQVIRISNQKIQITWECILKSNVDLDLLLRIKRIDKNDNVSYIENSISNLKSSKEGFSNKGNFETYIDTYDKFSIQLRNVDKDNPLENIIIKEFSFNITN